MIEIRRSSMCRPNGSIRCSNCPAIVLCYGLPDARHLRQRRSKTATSEPASMPLPSGITAMASATCSRRQLMAALGVHRHDVIASVVGELPVDPHEVHLAVRTAAELVIGDRHDAGSGEPVVAHHAAKRRPSHQLETDHRADRIAGQAEDRRAARDVPNANGLAGLIAICIHVMSAILPSTAFTTS